jgi:hypothetical protein
MHGTMSRYVWFEPIPVGALAEGRKFVDNYEGKNRLGNAVILCQAECAEKLEKICSESDTE